MSPEAVGTHLAGSRPVSSRGVGLAFGGATPHLMVYYEAPLGERGKRLAAGLLARGEADYRWLKWCFGPSVSREFAFQVTLDSSGLGATHASCASAVIDCGVAESDDPSLVAFEMIAEMAEVFMAAQGRGWDCGASNGEALSRVLATARYPLELRGFQTAAAWLNSDRGDYVTRVEQSDRNPVSIGCGTLFINYLTTFLGFSLSSVVQTGGWCLANTYEALTFRTDPYQAFRSLVDRVFPWGVTAVLEGDDPFGDLLALTA